jgi:hypothetical protein
MQNVIITFLIDLVKNEELKKELNRLESENFLLEQKIRREKEKMDTIQTDNARNTFNMDILSERNFNAAPDREYVGRKRARSTVGSSRHRSSSMPPSAHRAEINKLPIPESNNHGTLSSPEVSPRRSPRQSPRLSISPQSKPHSLPSRGNGSYLLATSSPLRNPYEDPIQESKGKLDMPPPSAISPQQSPRQFQPKLKLINKLSPREYAPNTTQGSGMVSQSLQRETSQDNNL